MTTPAERTKAVVDTRDFLEMLASMDEVTINGLVQSVASGLLRHFPNNIEIDVSAAALPSVWAPPLPARVVGQPRCAHVVRLARTRTNE
ncbi:BPSL0761 family protein [Paraburkholderia sediminicola]|uniref:BPSL0761 family protein n=1 Tax=Paraburkholderia sediminicola TaxID=458836 RepID=UPI0038B801D0